MRTMEEIFPFLWLLNAQNNSLIEPNELTRTLLADSAEFFHLRKENIEPEQLSYIKRELAAATEYLDESISLFERLRSEILASNLLPKGSEAE